MTEPDDIDLPPEYAVERNASGCATLRLDYHPIHEFAAAVASRAIAAWADAFEQGRNFGFRHGETHGRIKLASELRRLLLI